jgi:uncharacterized protein YkwD
MQFNYEDLKKSILTEHNRVRQDPTCYIPLLKEQMKYLKGDILYKPGEAPVQTNEGAAAYEEAISFLKKQRPVDALTYDERLSNAAEDHVKDIGPRGLVTHESSDGKTMSDRLELYCEWDTTSGENLEFGGKTGQDVIISLLVDDGVEGRGHRTNIFKTDFKYIGIACGSHRDYEVVTVLNYVGGIRDKDSPFFDYVNFKYDFPEEVTSSLKKQDKKKENKPKTSFQLNDPDAPDRTVSVKLMKKTKLFNGRKITVTKKFYLLDDGKQHIVEIEEF